MLREYQLHHPLPANKHTGYASRVGIAQFGLSKDEYEVRLCRVFFTSGFMVQDYIVFFGASRAEDRVSIVLLLYTLACMVPFLS